MLEDYGAISNFGFLPFCFGGFYTVMMVPYGNKSFKVLNILLKDDPIGHKKWGLSRQRVGRFFWFSGQVVSFLWQTGLSIKTGFNALQSTRTNGKEFAYFGTKM